MRARTQDPIASLVDTRLNAFHVDSFGFDPESIKPWMPLGRWLYEKYFRCETTGINNIPKGRFIAIANHSGQLPFDALMIAMAFLLEPKKPRLLRGMAERWSAELPFVSTLFARTGTIVGEPKSCEELLNREQAVLVFPEGVAGIAKPFKDRYRLTQFGHGFMRLALRTQSPIVPISLIGAEEQAPSIANLKWLGKMLGSPGFPIIFPHLLPFPLPVKYRIHIGKPMYFQDSTSTDAKVEQHVEEVRAAIQNCLAEGLKKRKNIFF